MYVLRNRFRLIERSLSSCAYHNDDYDNADDADLRIVTHGRIVVHGVVKLHPSRGRSVCYKGEAKPPHKNAHHYKIYIRSILIVYTVIFFYLHCPPPPFACHPSSKGILLVCWRTGQREKSAKFGVFRTCGRLHTCHHCVLDLEPIAKGTKK